MELSGEFPVQLLCETMGIRRSSFYSWKKHLSNPSNRTKAFVSNILLFQEYHLKYPSHGYRWLNAKIRLDTGLVLSDPYAHKCCKTAGIKSKAKHYKYKKPGAPYRVFPNLLLSEIRLDGPMQCIVSDMTAFYVKGVYYELTLYMDLWNNEKQILTNEKYIGDALLQKTYTINTLEKKRVVNNGIATKYYVEGSHEPIISKDVFLRVQAEITRRANITAGGKKRTYSSRYALSSIVLCGHCGDIFRRVVWQNRGNKIIVWRCVSRVLKKQSGVDCPARTLREEELQAAVVTAINDAYYQQNGIIPLLQNNVQKILKKDMEERLTLVEAALKEKQAELLKAEKDQVNEIGEAIINLREERQGILTEIAKNTELKERVDDISAFLGEQTEALTEYSEAMVRRLIEKVTVYDEKLTVEFKSGLTIDVDA